MMDYIHLAEWKSGGGAELEPRPTLRSSLSAVISLPLFFFLTLSLLIWSRRDGQTGRPVHVWQLISLAGGKQLDTANGGCGGAGGGAVMVGAKDVKSGGQDRVVDVARRVRVRAFSKIIHSAVATHFRLPPPITAVSSEGDRADRSGVA